MYIPQAKPTEKLFLYEPVADEPADELIPFRIAIAVAIEDQLRRDNHDLVYTYGLLWKKDENGLVTTPPKILENLTDYEYVDMIFAEVFFLYV